MVRSAVSTCPSFSTRFISLVVCSIVCVQVLSGASVGDQCQHIYSHLNIRFNVSDGQVTWASSHAEGESTAAESLCSSNASSCCPSTLVVDPFVKSSNIISQMFNNSEQFNRFRSKISLYESVISSHESSNVELWNATIDGLRVLGNWGVKYWDPGYLYRNNVFSSECVRRVVRGAVCGACAGESDVKICKSLCHNVVVGCLKSPLAEFIESPWKHAVNSVRTAIRLVITTGGDAKQNTQPLVDLISYLNDWREPLTWWVPEYKRTVSCEGLPTSACWNGDAVGKYEHGTVAWRSSYNPEFSGVGYRGDGIVHPNVIVELDRFRNELIGVRKSLEKFWPTTGGAKQPHALALSSSESISSPPRSSYIHDLVHETGSGDDSFESDDEDLEYVNSGYGPHIPDSDDEDYGGSGSGDGTDNNPTDDLGKVTDGFETGGDDNAPVSLSSSESVRATFMLGACALVLLLL